MRHKVFLFIAVPVFFILSGGLLLVCRGGGGQAEAREAGARFDPQKQKLAAAYPRFISGYKGNEILFKDGTAMQFSDGRENKDWLETLNNPDLEDMLSLEYPRGNVTGPFEKNFDPGRIRYVPFFKKMYGRSRREVEANLVPVKWMPRYTNITLYVTRINDVDRKLREISSELEKLPERLRKYVVSPGGTYNYRNIKDTDRLSMHSFGIAVDITVKYSHYWNWDYKNELDDITYRNDTPYEIVRIFEKYGFIWGGKWYHYDTMHFEYRPELLVDINDGIVR
jgi:peptidoglycan LD-endopeptidase CwlK